MPPLIVSHYDIISTINQKADAILSRTIIQARDIFDLYILSSQHKSTGKGIFKDKEIFKKISDRIIEVSFERFRDTVISYLLEEEKNFYNQAEIWDGVKLKVINFLEELYTNNG